MDIFLLNKKDIKCKTILHKNLSNMHIAMCKMHIVHISILWPTYVGKLEELFSPHSTSLPWCTHLVGTRVDRTLWDGSLLKNLVLTFFTIKPILLHFWIPLIKPDPSVESKFAESKIWPSYDPFSKTVFGGPNVGPGMIWALAFPNKMWK